MIQRPYKLGDREEYLEAAYGRDLDSAAVDTVKREEFRTSAGRIVFGGGGITPDIKVNPGRLTMSSARLRNSRAVIDQAQKMAPTYIAKYGTNFQAFEREVKISDDVLLQLAKGGKGSRSEVGTEG